MFSFVSLARVSFPADKTIDRLRYIRPVAGPPTGKSIGKSERQRRPDNLLIRAMLITQKLSLSLSILSRCSPTYGPHNSELRYSRRDNKKGVQTKTSPILPTPLTQKKKITPNGALLPRDSKVTKNADVKKQNKKQQHIVRGKRSGMRGHPLYHAVFFSFSLRELCVC